MFCFDGYTREIKIFLKHPTRDSIINVIDGYKKRCTISNQASRLSNANANRKQLAQVVAVSKLYLTRSIRMLRAVRPD